jgi:hypothetical protein
MQHCVSNFHSERDRGNPTLASASSSIESETAFKVHFAGRGGPLSSGSNAYVEDFSIYIVVTRRFRDSKPQVVVFPASAKIAVWPEDDRAIPGANLFKPFDAAQSDKLDEFIGSFSTYLNQCVGKRGSLDSGAKCNRAMQTGFARLCQAL